MNAQETKERLGKELDRTSDDAFDHAWDKGSKPYDVLLACTDTSTSDGSGTYASGESCLSRRDMTRDAILQYIVRTKSMTVYPASQRRNASHC
jgi:hypothetical protein